VRSDWVKGCGAGVKAFHRQGLVADVPWAPSPVPVPIGPPIMGAIALVDVPHHLNSVITVQYSVSEVVPGSGWFALEAKAPRRFQAIVSSTSKYRDDESQSLLGRTIDVTGRVTVSGETFQISDPSEIQVVEVRAVTSTTVKKIAPTTTLPSAGLTTTTVRKSTATSVPISRQMVNDTIFNAVYWTYVQYGGVPNWVGTLDCESPENGKSG